MKFAFFGERNEETKREISYAFYEFWRKISAILPSHKRPSRHKSIQQRQTRFVWAYLAIPILNFLVFWVYVNFDAITLAFRNIDFANGGVEYWTFDNFKTIYKMFTESSLGGRNMPLYGWNTLKYWLLSTVWCIPHSILLTYAMHKKVRGHKKFQIILYLPSLICAVALAGIFASTISSTGIFGFLLKTIGVERVPSWFGEVEYANGTLLFYNFFFGFMGHYILYSGAMANIDHEILDAAYVDGVTMWQELRYITIPSIWPTLGMTIITSFAALFSASGPILLFTKDLEQTWTFGYWIFDQVRVYQSYYLPAALGLCFTLVAFPIALLVRKAVDSMYKTE